MKILAGQYLNTFSRPNTALSLSAPDNKFPARNMADERLDTYAKWRTLDATPYVTGDQQLLRNGGAETGLTGWKKLNGPTSSTVQKHSGAKSFRLEVGETLEGDAVYQDVLCRSDEFLRISAWTMGDGVDVSTSVTLRDMKTGRYLQSDGTWDVTEAFLGLRLTASFAQVSITFQAEPFTQTLHHLTTIRVTAVASGAADGTGYVDDIELIPACDFAGVFDFNFPARMTPLIYSAETADFAGLTLRFSLEPKQPAFSDVLPARFYARYLRMYLDGEPIEKPWISEWVVGQTVTMLRSARFGSGWTAEWLFPPPNAKQTRLTRLKTVNRPQRTLRLQFGYADSEEFEQYRQLFVLRCRGENETCVVRFDEMDEVAGLSAAEMDSGLVLMGGLQGPRGHTLNVPDVRDALDILITEDRHPRGI